MKEIEEELKTVNEGLHKKLEAKALMEENMNVSLVLLLSQINSLISFLMICLYLVS